jgi:hypothetical protein
MDGESDSKQSMSPSPDSCETWICDSRARKSALSIGLGEVCRRSLQDCLAFSPSDSGDGLGHSGYDEIEALSCIEENRNRGLSA